MLYLIVFHSNMTISGSCKICGENISKYRCPKCSVSYCSLLCYKSHKEIGCGPTEVKAVNHVASRSTTHRHPADHLYDEGDDLIKRESLERLIESEKLKNILKNPFLKDLLTNLDKAPSHSLFESCMVEPEFVEFVDTCLSVIHPNEY